MTSAISNTMLCYFIAIFFWTTPVNSFTAKSPVRVVVTGASTSVGYLVFKKLLKSKTFFPVGLVRDKAGCRELKRLGVGEEQIRIGDITDRTTLKGVFDGANKVVLCTSARPRKTWWFRIVNFLLKLIGRDRPATGKDLYYPSKQDPYNVDFVGQKNVIDACLDAKVDHIVMLGNMGGYRGSKLNAIGREEGETNPKKGNLLKWKRAAERYLMKRCFFTIVHAGALIDERYSCLIVTIWTIFSPPTYLADFFLPFPNQFSRGGRREIVWDTDDALLRTSFRKIPREDVAEVLVQALIWKEAIGRSIDIASRPEGQGAGPTKDWLRFWSRPGNCVYPVDFDELDT